ncbi:MAG TPA: sn-glycerol-1-phosphate dehydrogenase [Opitutaceae bacterium]|nr:sn-glycerol-1-phosphate dehydrogenase [Opitutaceae bacterium]
MNRSAQPLSLEEALQSARETKALHVGPQVIDRVAQEFSRLFPGKTAALVTDATLFSLIGKRLQDGFVSLGLLGPAPFIFPEEHVEAEDSFVERVEKALSAHNGIAVAVGSGTLNDLVKLASHRLGRPYICVATAASMDGYTAFGASITYRGSKQTFSCPAPLAVFADTNVIRHAPASMTASGYADLLAKVTAGADWILADALGVEAIDPRAWEIVQNGLKPALADPEGARTGDLQAITLLIEGLLLGGFAMQWSKSSRPASGAEHQFSHLWDMEHHVHEGHAPSHGFKVGVATLAVSAFYEFLLAYPMDTLDIDSCCNRWLNPTKAEAQTRRYFATSDFLDTALTETKAKYLPREDLRLQLIRLKENWPATVQQLRGQLIPFAEMKQRLQAVGAPTEPEQIGITRTRLRNSFIRAQQIRRRFTVLDLAVRTDTLHAGLAALFGPGGRWEIPPHN